MVGTSGRPALDAGFLLTEADLQQRAQAVVDRLQEMTDHAHAWAARLLAIEALHLANTVGQLAFTDRFLGGEYLQRGLGMFAIMWGDSREQNFSVM